MRVAVLIKQVPAVDTVKINEITGTMEREGVESELNPMDLHALEAAIRLKESNPAGTVHITAITMGPAQSKKILANAIAMGCDDALLLSDKAVAGADTWATAKTLAIALKMNGPFDLVFAGERATDGETGQVAPAVAEFLGYPALTFVSGIETVKSGEITVKRAIEGGHETLRSPIPALLAVVKELNRPRLCTLSGKLRAKSTPIPQLSASDLGLDELSVGIKGSPTRVVRVLYPQVTRMGERYPMAADPDTSIRALYTFLEDKGFVKGGAV